MVDVLTGPWCNEDDCFDLRTISRHKDQLEPAAMIDRLVRANRSLNKLLAAWGQHKIGQSHDLYVHNLPAATMTPAARALFLHVYLDILHPAVLLGDSAPSLNLHDRDRALVETILAELVKFQLIDYLDGGTAFFVKDFMVGGALVRVGINYLTE
ncbi:hypothetical protein JW905_09685 [bacterium]|nr:hypothetical protein [candidate division CSSED10-310 bacterium]